MPRGKTRRLTIFSISPGADGRPLIQQTEPETSHSTDGAGDLSFTSKPHNFIQRAACSAVGPESAWNFFFKVELFVDKCVLTSTIELLTERIDLIYCLWLTGY